MQNNATVSEVSYSIDTLMPAAMDAESHARVCTHLLLVRNYWCNSVVLLSRSVVMETVLTISAASFFRDVEMGVLGHLSLCSSHWFGLTMMSLMRTVTLLMQLLTQSPLMLPSV